MCLFVSTEYMNVTDRQTNRQTDEQTDTAQRRRLRLCIASRGKNAHFVFSGSQTVSSTHCSYPQRGKVR